MWFQLVCSKFTTYFESLVNRRQIVFPDSGSPEAHSTGTGLTNQGINEAVHLWPDISRLSGKNRRD